MNPNPTLRRAAGTLAGIATAVLASPAAALASASPRPARPAPADSRPANWPPLPPGWNKHPPLPTHAHTITVGGTPGWQITLIAAAAALLATVVAVTIHRVRAARQRATAAAA
jgi:hypothetical protein